MLGLQVPFIPKKWRPSHPDVPHIPYTFPPKPTGPGSGRGGGSNSGGGRRGGRGGGNALGRGKGKQPQGKRARKMPPTAWTIGARTNFQPHSLTACTLKGCLCSIHVLLTHPLLITSSILFAHGAAAAVHLFLHLVHASN